VTMEKRAI